MHGMPYEILNSIGPMHYGGHYSVGRRRKKKKKSAEKFETQRSIYASSMWIVMDS